MKTLFVMRHAEAEEALPDMDDAQRNLTKKGKKATRAVGRWMARNDLCVDRIASSPLTRALKTARILSEELEGPEPVTVPELAGQASAKDLALALAGLFEGADTVLVVGHQPQLGQLVSLLVTGGIFGRFELGKASLCRIVCEEFRPGKCGSLDLLVRPDLL